MSTDSVTQRWKKPVTALAVDDTFEWATSDLGRATLDYKARFLPEQIERFRLGYICLECWEPHETPFPEKCELCGYEMRERQASDFARKFQGVERHPRAKLIETELDALDGKHERNYYETNSGIVVTKSLANPKGI